jgi:hypothetical protein
LFNTPFFRLADVTVTPDFNGLPPNVMEGLRHLTNNMAALLLVVAVLGIVTSIVGWVAGSVLHSHQIAERSRQGLFVSATSGAGLFIAVAALNYTTGLFR